MGEETQINESIIGGRLLLRSLAPTGFREPPPGDSQLLGEERGGVEVRVSVDDLRWSGFALSVVALDAPPTSTIEDLRDTEVEREQGIVGEVWGRSLAVSLRRSWIDKEGTGIRRRDGLVFNLGVGGSGSLPRT